MKGKYKDEDSGIIFEYLSKGDKEVEEWREFSSAIKRVMVKNYNNEIELEWLRKQVREQKEKERGE